MCTGTNHTYISRMLGYSLGIPELGSAYGPASVNDVFKLTDMNCNGSEESLEDCFYRFGNCWLQMKLRQFSNENRQQLHQVYLPQNYFFSGTVKAARGGRWQASLASQVSTNKSFSRDGKINIEHGDKKVDLKTSIA